MTIIDRLIAVGKPLCLLVISTLALMSINVQAQSADNPDDLYKQIQSLQSLMAIKITGLEKIQNEEKVFARGSLEEQLEQLLASYNHIVSRNAKGQIERIVIVNKKQKTDVESIILPTTLQGNHFMVSVAISGLGGNLPRRE